MDESSLWSPGNLLRRIARRMARIYYSKFEISDRDRIPKSGGVLLCANHPNSLMDPIVVGLTANRPVKFFAKAPLFDIPVLGSIMKALGMIPAYRGVDDRKQVRKNLESLDIGIMALVNGETVGIFPEGKSHDLERVEMVRGGAARIVLRAVKKGAEDMHVVPIGLNYQDKERFRSSVWVQVGEPIDINSWLADVNTEETNDKQLSRAFTELLESRLQDVTIHLDDHQWQPWLNDLEHLAPEVNINVKTDVPELRRRMQIANAMNYYLKNDPEEATEIAHRIEEYRENVAAVSLRPSSPVLHQSAAATLLKVSLTFLLQALFLPLAIAGTVFHLIPFVIVRAIASRVTPAGRTSVSFYRLLIGAPIYAVWYGVAIVLSLNWLTWWQVLACCFVLPLAGITALEYWGTMRRIIPEAWYQLIAVLKPRRIQDALSKQAEIKEKLEALTMRVPEDA